jgi:hypothetical protein
MMRVGLDHIVAAEALLDGSLSTPTKYVALLICPGFVDAICQDLSPSFGPKPDVDPTRAHVDPLNKQLDDASLLCRETRKQLVLSSVLE